MKVRLKKKIGQGMGKRPCHTAIQSHKRPARSCGAGVGWGRSPKALSEDLVSIQETQTNFVLLSFSFVCSSVLFPIRIDRKSELISTASKIFSTLKRQESVEEKSFIDVKEDKEGRISPGILSI